MSFGDLVGGSTYRTTYNECYRLDSLPQLTHSPTLYHQQPAIALLGKVDQLAPRSFPLIPAGPKRRVCIAKPTLGLGLGTGYLNTERFLNKKPIVKTDSPYQITLDNPAVQLHRCTRPSVPDRTERLRAAAQANGQAIQELRETLCRELTWSSTTCRSTEEAALPIKKAAIPPTTYEQNADLVKLRPKKYEQGVAEWQVVYPTWDRAQSRGRTRRGATPDTPVTLRQSNLLPRRRTQTAGSTSKAGDIENLLKSGQLNTPYVSQTPGYAGFLPRSTIEAPLSKVTPDRHVTTIMRDSYRPLPEQEYRVQTYNHKGPMSRTVTLTYPYNPFNKLEKREDINS